MIDERSREIINGIRSICNRYWLGVYDEQFEGTTDAILKTNEIIASLKLYLSAAVGTDKSIVLLILGIIREIDSHVDEFTKNKKTPESLKKLEMSILEVLGSKLEECDLLEMKILSKYSKSPKRWSKFSFRR